VLVGLLMLSSLVGRADAKDCKDVLVVDDPLDGRSVSYTHYMDKGRYTGFDVQLIKGAWTLHLLTVELGRHVTSGAPGELARIAVGSEILELPASSETPPVGGMNAMTAQVFTQWRVEYALTADQLTTLTQAPISVIGFAVAGKEYRFTLDEKDGARVREGLACARSQAGTG
jgi:hypothetical protein